MNLDTVYPVQTAIRQHFRQLSQPQSFNLAAFCCGMITARDCRLPIVAEELGCLGKADSVERRLQRFLANLRIDDGGCQRDWTRWVLRQWESETVTLLVDETKLGVHIGVMMVGLAYQQRCIPLVWRTYKANSVLDYPAEGQVAMIAELLAQVALVLPLGTRVLVQADQGLGTSPNLIRAVLVLGWDYLFRVQGTSQVLFESGDIYELRQLVERGQTWCGQGHVFKGDGFQIEAQLRLIWAADYDQAWYLLGSDPDLTGWEYGQRNWEEQAFRDLKSGGWKWDDSHVWLPAHAHRLLLVLALAYGWMLTLGAGLRADDAQRRQTSRGTRCRLSIFRLGLRFFKAAQRAPTYLALTLAFPRLFPPLPPPQAV